MTQSRFSRRRFLKTTSSGLLLATFVPRAAWGANDQVNVGCIGIGGKGRSDVSGVAGAGGNILALCDVDENRRGKKINMAEDFPHAVFYHDFREMLEKEAKRIDAVTVSTPDHTHAPAAMMAIEDGQARLLSEASHAHDLGSPATCRNGSEGRRRDPDGKSGPCR